MSRVQEKPNINLFWNYLNFHFSSILRYFFEFLLAHHQQVAREIRDEYVDTMSKIYSAYFGGYIAKLMKLQASLINIFNLLNFKLTISLFKTLLF